MTGGSERAGGRRTTQKNPATLAESMHCYGP
jgi:hypothetical protein